MPVPFMQRVLGIVFLVVIVAGLMLPQIPLFVPASDALGAPEEICAWQAAKKFAYTKAELMMIRNHTTRQSLYGPGYYTVYPVTFFSLPWPKATVQCTLNRNRKLTPTGGWTASIENHT